MSLFQYQVLESPYVYTQISASVFTLDCVLSSYISIFQLSHLSQIKCSSSHAWFNDMNSNVKGVDIILPRSIEYPVVILYFNF